MKPFLKKTVLILLFSAIVLETTACAAEKKQKSDETTAETTNTTVTIEDERAKVADSLPDTLDFGGATITILTRDSDGAFTAGSKNLGKSMYEDELSVDELTNDVLNDAIYNRNLAVEARLNCTLEIIKTDSSVEGKPSSAMELMEKAVNSGDNDYQIYADNARSIVDNSLKGWFYDLYEFDYLDFSKPWWYQMFQEHSEINGHLYCADGSLSLSTLRSSCGVFFNKQIAENYGIDNLYDLVDSGKWTIDALTEISNSVYKDVNGNSERDKEDLYGFTPMITESFLCAFDISFLSKNADGAFVFDCNYEKLSSAFDKVFNLYWNCTGTNAEYASQSTKEPLKNFSSGNSLFLLAMLYFAEDGDTLRNMTDEYGILPLPKYNEAQKDYLCSPCYAATAFSIPITNPDPDTAAAVLEAMNAETYRRVISAYSDIALKGKYLNDAQSRKMFDLIIDGMTIESSIIYADMISAFPDKVWSIPISSNDSDEFVTAYNSNSKKMSRVVELMNKEFEKLDEK